MFAKWKKIAYKNPYSLEPERKINERRPRVAWENAIEESWNTNKLGGVLDLNRKDW